MVISCPLKEKTAELVYSSIPIVQNDNSGMSWIVLLLGLIIVSGALALSLMYVKEKLL